MNSDAKKISKKAKQSHTKVKYLTLFNLTIRLLSITLSESKAKPTTQQPPGVYANHIISLINFRIFLGMIFFNKLPVFLYKEYN